MSPNPIGLRLSIEDHPEKSYCCLLDGNGPWNVAEAAPVAIRSGTSACVHRLRKSGGSVSRACGEGRSTDGQLPTVGVRFPGVRRGAISNTAVSLGEPLDRRGPHAHVSM